MPNNDNGKWVTLDNGAHVFIKNGQSVEEALAERDKAHNDLTDTMVKQVKWVQAQTRYKPDDEGKLVKVPPKKYCTDRLRKALETRAKDEELFAKAIEHNVDELMLKDTDNSWLSQGTATHDKIVLHVSIAETKVGNCCSYFHEVGHALDRLGFEKWMSSTFVSPTHGVTLIDMFKQEFGSIDPELLHDEFDYLNSSEPYKELKDKYKASGSDNDKEEYRYHAQHCEEATTSFVDMIQAIHGNDTAMKIGGWLPHETSYFLGNRGNQHAGTELFAELCESYHSDKNGYFYKLIKQYCPKTVEIYHEILEKRREEWK